MAAASVLVIISSSFMSRLRKNLTVSGETAAAPGKDNQCHRPFLSEGFEGEGGGYCPLDCKNAILKDIWCYLFFHLKALKDK